MTILSQLLLMPVDDGKSALGKMDDLKSTLRNISQDEFDNLVTLANSNHVVVRAMEVLLNIARDTKDGTRAEWALVALEAERVRIRTAVTFLQSICAAFESEGYGVTVIKSLDHWPDLGSDLDMYTDTKPEDVFRLMAKHFHAGIDSRSWGDRLAGKWNFLIPGLPEAVEVHMGRLGQTGEQVTIASSLAKRSRLVLIGDQKFRVPSTSDRLLISVLQRMYRHFYFRLCDMVDSAALVETGGVDYKDLRSAASSAGIWEGVASYLAIVSDYVRQYRGSGLDLPHFLVASARFGGDEIYYGNGFLRVPIMPQSVKLYGAQLAVLVRKRELINSARLSLLPWLATAALVGQKITGSDKGIW
jgi:hypothetical protein